MAWWGKLAGGAFGFMLGGPLGAVLGAALGHSFDTGIARLDTGLFHAGDQERIQTAFFTTTFSVMGHLAKVDGRVSRREIAMAEQLMRQMQLPPDQRRAAIELFNTGKDPGFPLDDVLQQFRHECHRRTTLLQMFLEIQIHAALADGELNAVEQRLLLHIASQLGFAPEQLDRLLHMLGSGAGGRGGPARQADELAAAYEVLGVTPKASDAEVKRAYRRLMNQHHPDKLVAKGLPEEMMELATETTQKIRAAYERVRQSRR